VQRKLKQLEKNGYVKNLQLTKAGKDRLKALQHSRVEEDHVPF
jgi:hypothetical protein